MALGLTHYGLSTDELLGGTRFKAVLAERMRVWDELTARLTAKEGAGGIMIEGSPLGDHMAGSRGVKYLVNRGPCFTHVDPMNGYMLGLDPETDSIRALGGRPYSVNNLTVLLGIRNPDDDLIASFEEILERARLDLLQGSRKDELLALVNDTAQMSMTSAFNAFLMLRSNGSNVERVYKDWMPSGVTPFDVMADWLKVLAEASVFLSAYFRRKYLNEDFIEPVAGKDFVTSFIDGLGTCDSSAERERQLRILNRLLNNMPYHDPGNVSTYAGVVVASSGVSPWHVYAAAASGLWGRDHGGAAPFAGGQMLAALTDVGIDTDEGELHNWWNAWLDKYDAAMAIGHRVLRSPDGDPRTLGLLDDLDEEFPNNGHPLLRFARLHYKVGVTEILERHPQMGFQEANVDAYSWATKVMIGLIQMTPEHVEAGFLAFLLSRIVGVMKEDFWYRLPKSTVLRPSPIHWWEVDPELTKIAAA
ncbi:MAG: citrate/2-methylcitrate synthase [Candidatus Tectomicrobia bacterium]